MTTFILIIHTLICILLCLVILMQSGRGGGLTESFSSAESVFGAKTNSFMVKTTTVFASIFLVTCLTLAFLSSRRDRSLMSEGSLLKKESTPRGIPVVSPDSNAIKKMNSKEEGEDAKKDQPKVSETVIELPSVKQHSQSPDSVDEANGRWGVGKEKLNNATVDAGPQSQPPAK